VRAVIHVALFHVHQLKDAAASVIGATWKVYQQKKFNAEKTKSSCIDSLELLRRERHLAAAMQA